MDNQYTFTQEDMQRLTAIVHIDECRRVPEQVMNMLEGLLLFEQNQPATPEEDVSHLSSAERFKPGDKCEIISHTRWERSSAHGFNVGEIVEVDFVDDEDDIRCSNNEGDCFYVHQSDLKLLTQQA